MKRLNIIGLIVMLFFAHASVMAQVEEQSQEVTEEEEMAVDADEIEDEDEDDDDDKESEKSRTRKYINFDLGLSNYHNNGTFPDATNELYSVKPWGSWNLAISSVYRTQIAGALFVEYGGGISWYNFKMQDPSVRFIKGDENVEFTQDAAGHDYIKSKLQVTHLNLFVVPMIRTDKKISRNSSSSSSKFRIGVGGYAGYRVGSRTRVVYNDGKKQKDVSKSNYHLNNIRYGIRAQMGWKGTDIYVNYDLSSLYNDGRGPELTPISFGIIF